MTGRTRTLIKGFLCILALTVGLWQLHASVCSQLSDEQEGRPNSVAEKGRRQNTAFSPVITELDTYVRGRWANTTHRNTLIRDAYGRTKKVRQFGPAIREDRSFWAASELLRSQLGGNKSESILRLVAGIVNNVTPRSFTDSIELKERMRLASDIILSTPRDSLEGHRLSFDTVYSTSWIGPRGEDFHRRLVMTSTILVDLIYSEDFRSLSRKHLGGFKNISFFQKSRNGLGNDHLAAVAEGVLSVLAALNLLGTDSALELDAATLVERLVKGLHDHGNGTVSNLSLQLPVNILVPYVQRGVILPDAVVLDGDRPVLEPTFFRWLQEKRREARNTNLESYFHGFGCPLARLIKGKKSQVQVVAELFLEIFKSIDMKKL